MGCTILVAGLVAVNLGGYVVAAADKRRAQRGRGRVPERTLLVVALVGGGLGMATALLCHRHKTRKASFLVPFWLATGFGAAAAGAALAWFC